MRRLSVLLLLSLVGCKHVFPVPYSVSALTEDSSRWPGDALVHYLAQPGADPTVCEPSRGALVRFDEELSDPYVAALEEDRLPADLWSACGRTLLEAFSPTLRERLFGKLSRVVITLLDEEKAAARLIAVNEVLEVRAREPSASLDGLLERLLGFDRAKLPPTLPPVLDALVTTLELDHGRLGGKPLTATDIEAVQDDGLLLRIAARVPDESLRLAARRRLVRLRIERSDWPEVKARAAEVEAQVMSYGRWAQPVAKLKLQRPGLPLALPFQGVVQQNVGEQLATLRASGQEHLEMAPVVDLRPLLQFDVGFSRPLSLCAPAVALRVEPCVDVAEVEFQGAGQVDARGVLRLPDQFSMEQAFEVARSGEGLSLVVRLRGQLVTSLVIPLRFETPSSWYFEGSEGQRGPAVNVVAISTADALLLAGVTETGDRRFVVLPRGATAFEFGSRGGQGARGVDGQRGTTGQRGYDGTAAVCPSTPASNGGRGGQGGYGGDGGDGGPGGDGGAVNVELRCSLDCERDREWLRSVVRSRGGSGGAGGSMGSGGRGGDGGRGGSGTTCGTTTLSSGTDGSRGDDGANGSSGRWGPDGRDGDVNFAR